MYEFVLYWLICLLSICGIIGTIGFVVDKLRTRQEIRKITSEKYIRYRINRWNTRGY
ncbi:MAG: hypothetical protein J6R59_10710 [Paludibacteraceae bacterium]|nr:hypothetical protein [Paludibacteraceae bacterium]